jgi:hypothetical protein
MTKKLWPNLLLLPLLVAACGAEPASTAPVESVTSEEVRLSDLGQSKQKLVQGRTYRVIGRIRNIQAAADGSPTITFTGLVLRVEKGQELGTVKQMKPGNYIEADCTLIGVQSGIFPEMTGCRNLAFPTTLSAEDYEAAYSDNVFNADDELKDRPLVIFGPVRLVGKLNGGEDYVAVEAQPGFSDVTAIVTPANQPLIRTYAKVGELAVMYCRGGYRYNQIGSIGVTDCRFLQNY